MFKFKKNLEAKLFIIKDEPIYTTSQKEAEKEYKRIKDSYYTLCTNISKEDLLRLIAL